MPVEVLRSRYNLEALRQSGCSMAALDGVGTIAWANPAWFAFGLRNAADPGAIAVGVSYVGAIQGPLRGEFEGMLSRARAEQQPFSFDYECSSASEQRVFRAHGVPLGSRGTLIVHSLRFTRREDGSGPVPSVTDYLDENGFLAICSHCRRVRSRVGRWDWVPAWVEKAPAAVTHALCHVCEGFYWGYIVPTHVLLVGSDPLLGELARNLRVRGYAVSQAAGLPMALRELSKQPFDALVVGDSVSPDSRLAFVRGIREGYPATRCAVVTGAAAPADLDPQIRWVSPSTPVEALVELMPRPK